MKRRYGFDEIVKMVERIKGGRWEAFRERYGDWGRDLVLWAGRRYGGLTLSELGKLAGGADYSAVAMGIRRLEARSRGDRVLSSAMRRVSKQCQ